MYDIQNIINDNLTDHYQTSYYDIHLFGQVYFNDNDTLSYYLQNFDSLTFFVVFGIFPSFFTFSR